jgi:signal transduction histidine kinase
MTQFVVDDFRSAIALRLRTEHEMLSTRWLARLLELLPVDAGEVFPGGNLLDHIPDLIVEIAGYVANPKQEAISANTTIVHKAQELGTLRHGQRASVHQILREYRLLDAVIFAFVEEEAAAWGATALSAHVVAVTADLHYAISVLQEATVASFITRYIDEIREGNDRLTTFNRMVSHELRQPMGTLQFALRLLKNRESAHPDTERERLLALVERNVDRAVQLTDRLARVSGLSTDDGNLHLQHVSIATVAREVARQLRDMADAREVAIDVDDSLPSSVLDVAALELTLLNLVSNALKYSDPGKPSRFVRIARRTSVADQCVIEVMDNGLGIPDSVLGDVFERSLRAHAHRDEELGTGGLGLGLVIVRDCVRRLQGSITVSSTEGEGTRFTLQFPLRESTQADS